MKSFFSRRVLWQDVCCRIFFVSGVISENSDFATQCVCRFSGASVVAAVDCTDAKTA